MRKRTLIPIAIICSIAFNVGFVIYHGQGNQNVHWLFFELGPAVLQDSFFARAPGLESPFGMIGDIPGGYSLYSGNPLQTEYLANLTGFSDSSEFWIFSPPTFSIQNLIIGLLFAIVPLISIIILGRRSYGSTKTQ